MQILLPTPTGTRMTARDSGSDRRQNEAQISLINNGQWN